MQNAFFNPYNFVATPPRDVDHVDLGDHEPAGHSRVHEGRYSGSLEVGMKAVTPLLIPSSDVSVHESVSGHRIKNTRRTNRNGRVEAAIPPSSVKGMVRSAFEMITNSRYAVFASHSQRLGMRQLATEGLLALPAIVVEVDGEHYLRVLLGNCTYSQLSVVNGYRSSTGLQLTAKVEMNAVKGDRFARGADRRVRFTYDQATMKVGKIYSAADSVPAGTPTIEGYLHRTGPGVRKENEHVFFAKSEANTKDFKLTKAIADYWREVISDSEITHEGETDKNRPLYLHQREVDGWRELKPADTCFVRIRRVTDGEDEVELVQPVQIGRQLHPKSPLELLDPSLRPASQFSEFSPADRVFGWVAESAHEDNKNRSAYAGHVRFGRVRCLKADSIEKIEPRAVLAVLNAPKPTMARFYLGRRNDKGRVSPYEDGEDKSAIRYDDKSGLRGRKVYPHHGGFDRNSGRWRSTTTRNGSTEEKFNYSITDWVKEGTPFSFTVHFRNLTAFELGALLLSLETGEGQCHRLGGGRPLGFGSVHLSVLVSRSRVASFGDIASAWETLGGAEESDGEWYEKARSAALDVVAKTKPYRDYQAYLRGYVNDNGIPVSYPRVTLDRTDPESVLKWFTENERSFGIDVDQRQALPEIGATTKHALRDYTDVQAGRHRGGGYGGGGRPQQGGRPRPPGGGNRPRR